jgi:hypothetical protein
MLHRGEAVIPAEENISAGRGRVTIQFVNRGVITTPDVQTWFADMMAGIREGRVGEEYLTRDIEIVGLNI